MKIWRKRLTQSVSQSVNYEAVYRTAPATPGLLNIGCRITCSFTVKGGGFGRVSRKSRKGNSQGLLGPGWSPSALGSHHPGKRKDRRPGG